MDQSLEKITQFPLAVKTNDFKKLRDVRLFISERYLMRGTHIQQNPQFTVLCVFAEVFISKEWCHDSLFYNPFRRKTRSLRT